METSIHAQFFLNLRNVCQKLHRKITHFVFSNVFFENRAVYEKWKNIVEPDRRQWTIWRMLNASWIPKATNTHTV
jgi:hypothetical protein